MAEYEERNLEDLTEEPSSYRIEELRKKGITVQSRELTSTLVLMAAIGAVYLTGSKFFINYKNFILEIFQKDLIFITAKNQQNINDLSFYLNLLQRSFKLLFFTFLPIAGLGLVVGIIASVTQTGFLFTQETIKPDFQRVNPLSGFMRLFSFQTLTEGLKSILKFAVIIFVVYQAIRSEFFNIPNLVGLSLNQTLSYSLSVIIKIMFFVALALLATSGFDYFIQWRRYRMQAMMTKQEAKQEHKEHEGDPQLKARIKSIQRERARKRMMQNVPKADVVITNPTHFAVAIVYNPEENYAPKVVAKGADFLAQKIKQIAREHNVPMVENVALARSLYKHVKVGQLIPRSLYKAVAEVLAYVYKIRGVRPKSRQNLETS
jgi:flagellar biosynthetic protein FlhB